ncbi:MAG: hypothetical protein M3Y09_18915, partial [Actinomycetota bacterium]|nr:hypothetical protein [Actinomycetota bacterium]
AEVARAEVVRADAVAGLRVRLAGLRVRLAGLRVEADAGLRVEADAGLRVEGDAGLVAPVEALVVVGLSAPELLAVAIEGLASISADDFQFGFAQMIEHMFVNRKPVGVTFLRTDDHPGDPLHAQRRRQHRLPNAR